MIYHENSNAARSFIRNTEGRGCVASRDEACERLVALELGDSELDQEFTGLQNSCTKCVEQYVVNYGPLVEHLFFLIM